METLKKALIGCLVPLLVTVVGFLVLMLVLSAIFGSPTRPQDLPGDKIAQIELSGVISSVNTGFGGSSTDQFVRTMRKVREDDSVKAVVLRVNSPGGEVTASDTMFHAIKQTADAKPVVAYMNSVAASGGYYAACGATEIWANETTLTGSIGVIIQTLNYTDLFEKVGVESIVFTSGKYKDTLSGGREMREDEMVLIQEMITEMYEKFLSIVSEARGIDPATLRNGIADGRVMSGTTAAEVGLVDHLGYLENAIAHARDLSNAPDAKLVKYSEEPSLLDALGALKARMIHGETRDVNVNLSGNSSPVLQPGMIYLLPASYAR